MFDDFNDDLGMFDDAEDDASGVNNGGGGDDAMDAEWSNQEEEKDRGVCDIILFQVRRRIKSKSPSHNWKFICTFLWQCEK